MIAYSGNGFLQKNILGETPLDLHSLTTVRDQAGLIIINKRLHSEECLTRAYKVLYGLKLPAPI